MEALNLPEEGDEKRILQNTILSSAIVYSPFPGYSMTDRSGHREKCKSVKMDLLRSILSLVFIPFIIVFAWFIAKKRQIGTKRYGYWSWRRKGQKMQFFIWYMLFIFFPKKTCFVIIGRNYTKSTYRTRVTNNRGH